MVGVRGNVRADVFLHVNQGTRESTEWEDGNPLCILFTIFKGG